MRTVGERLSAQEAADLGRLEKVVEAGVEAFRAVGDALVEILERRLYRGSHGSFDAYCRERWGFAGRRAYRLIKAAAVTAELEKTVWPSGPHSLPSLPILPQNERQARAIADVPAEHRAEVWRRGVEEAGGPPSPSRVQELLDKVRRGAPPAEVAQDVRAMEEEVKAAGADLDGAAAAETYDWHVGKARWHNRQTGRHLRKADQLVREDGCREGDDLGEDVASLDALIVARYGDVPPSD